MRLPLEVTCHTDCYREDALKDALARYDAERGKSQPYGQQRFVQTFGEKPNYGWSDDKMRQYSQPERADFGAFVRTLGFKLD